MGCSSNLKPAKAEMHDIRVGNVTPAGVVFDVRLDVTNPNEVALPVTSTRYRLALAGMKLLDGEKNPQVTIGPGETKQITLPLTMNFMSFVRIGPAMMHSEGGVSYQADLNVRLGESGLFKQSARTAVHKNGMLDLDRLANDPDYLLNSSPFQGFMQGLLPDVSEDE